MKLLRSKVLQKTLSFIFCFGCLLTCTQGQIDWTPAMDIAPSTYGKNRPRIVTDASGNPLVIWGMSGKVMFARWEGTEFSSAVQLNPDIIPIAEATWMGPDIAAHGDTVYVVFKQTPEDLAGSHVWCMRSFDGGITFSSPVQVEDVPDGRSRFPAVTTDDLGNPIVAFMKFNTAFGNARWVVTRSTDFGNTFSPDVLASRWSSPNADVCDCCPGTITCAGEVVSMLYRDNNSNIRDSWAGISTDTGTSFDGGMNIDQQNWMLNACPASGPDGVLIGDTLYSTFMNGASGLGRVYFSASSVSTMQGSAGNLLTGDIPGLGPQNYPRIAHAGDIVAVVWRQIVSGHRELPVLFSGNITAGLPSAYETIASGGLDNPDVALTPENIFVVWQDDNTGTVKFRSGTFETSGTRNTEVLERYIVFPNPSENAWTLKGNFRHAEMHLELLDTQGRLLNSFDIEQGEGLNLEIENTDLRSGVYFIRITNQQEQFTCKVLKK